MIITLKNTTSAEVASRIVELRDERGSAALSRVLTLLICVPDLIDVDNAIEVSDAVSREHPCRVIVIVEPESTEGTARLNAQIRVGDAAGLSDIIILEPRGAAASNIDSLVMPLLQSDTPVVTYWPSRGQAHHRFARNRVPHGHALRAVGRLHPRRHGSRVGRRYAVAGAARRRRRGLRPPAHVDPRRG